MEYQVGQSRVMRVNLDRQLAAFLRKSRGTMTYAEFSRKLGFPPSTLHRLENAGQSITLRNLQQIMSRLKCGLSDIFGDEFHR